MEIPLHKQLHFIGIGGAGMSALAKILIQKGYTISGSDLKESINTIRLKDMGAKIYYGHDQSNLRGAHLVVYSTAIPPTNPEFQLAQQDNIPMLRRAEMLSVIMDSFAKRISVAGTHGKTTTSSMLTSILMETGSQPTYIVGSEILGNKSNASLGTSSYCVAETDESDGSFLVLHPNQAIITNIECDHMEFFKSKERLCDFFTRFMKGVLSQKGTLFLNSDDPLSMDLTSSFPKENCCYFSIDNESKFRAASITFDENGVSFDLMIDGNFADKITLNVFGKHNVYNALSVIAVAYNENIPLDIIKKGLFSFEGTKRRFQLVGESNQIHVFDDYAHHPTEISTTLEGAKKSLNRRLFCIFQPHRHTRTRDLMAEFSTCFDMADHVIITEIFSANEPKINGVSGQVLSEQIKKNGSPSVSFVEKKSNIVSQLLSQIKPGDVVVTMGAGDIGTVGKELLRRIESHKILPHD